MTPFWLIFLILCCFPLALMLMLLVLLCWPRPIIQQHPPWERYPQRAPAGERLIIGPGERLGFHYSNKTTPDLPALKWRDYHNRPGFRTRQWRRWQWRRGQLMGQNTRSSRFPRKVCLRSGPLEHF